ncbi:MAG: hypothetical protein PHS17_20010, partial [Desulfobacterales bacterium]|nr:hypothetical protein [Desulfobacterales bacterium]
MSDTMRAEDSKQIEPDSVPSGPDMRAKEALKKVTYDLGERVKELNCLYAISEFFERPNISLDEILQSTVNIIPS